MSAADRDATSYRKLLLCASLRRCFRSMGYAAPEPPAVPVTDPVAAVCRYWLARGACRGDRYL